MNFDCTYPIQSPAHHPWWWPGCSRAGCCPQSAPTTRHREVRGRTWTATGGCCNPLACPDGPRTRRCTCPSSPPALKAYKWSDEYICGESSGIGFTKVHTELALAQSLKCGMCGWPVRTIQAQAPSTAPTSSRHTANHRDAWHRPWSDHHKRKIIIRKIRIHWWIGVVRIVSRQEMMPNKAMMIKETLSAKPQEWWEKQL